MPRLFAGLQIPPEISDELALLRGGMFGARWIDPEFYHLTLRFFGDIDVATARELCHALERIERPEVEVVIDGLAAFGGDRPRALYAAARATQPLTALQSECERAARRAGLAAETRKFTPHVTLARLRGVSSDVVADYLTFRAGPRPLIFTAKHVVLYSSRDSIGGGPYVVEAEFPLRSSRIFDSEARSREQGAAVHGSSGESQ